MPRTPRTIRPRTPWITAPLATLLSAFVAASCGGSSESTGPGVTGSCGAVPSGTLTATVNGSAFASSFSTQATAQNSNAAAPNIVQVNGVECPSGGAQARQILITVGRLTPITAGTYGLGASAQGQPAGSGYTGIGQVTQAPNLWYSNISDAAGAGSGSITFTTVSATRLAGTFQLDAAPVGSNATTARGHMTVTNGTFDIPVR